MYRGSKLAVRLVIIWLPVAFQAVGQAPRTGGFGVTGPGAVCRLL